MRRIRRQQRLQLAQVFAFFLVGNALRDTDMVFLRQMHPDSARQY